MKDEMKCQGKEGWISVEEVDARESLKGVVVFDAGQFWEYVIHPSLADKKFVVPAWAVEFAEKYADFKLGKWPSHLPVEQVSFADRQQELSPEQLQVLNQTSARLFEKEKTVEQETHLSECPACGGRGLIPMAGGGERCTFCAEEPAAEPPVREPEQNSDRYIPAIKEGDFNPEKFKQETERGELRREIIKSAYNGIPPPGWGLISACMQKYADDQLTAANEKIAHLEAQNAELREQLK